MAVKVTTVIPARLGSKRFPDKVIYPLLGRPLLFYIIKELKKSKLIDKLVVATDSRKIAELTHRFETEVILTSSRPKTGSDRIAEILDQIAGSVIINFQADNFGLKAPQLDRLIANFLHDKKEQFGTIAYPIKSDEELFNPDTVKLICDKDDHALWFSRYPIPFIRDAEENNRFAQFKFRGHCGVYFFRRASLKKFASWKRGVFEKTESLEQLRILENGAKIKVYHLKSEPVSVDSPDDLKKLKRIYK